MIDVAQVWFYLATSRIEKRSRLTTYYHSLGRLVRLTDEKAPPT